LVAGIYVINQPSYMSVLWKLVRPFMKQKMKGRVHMHGKDTAAMLEASGLAAEQVPPNYGGALEIESGAWLAQYLVPGLQ
jgi:hypothetical protein